MPWLTRDDAREVVAQTMGNTRVADEIAGECGPWIGLLRIAASVMRSRPASDWNDVHRHEVIEKHLPILLGQALLPLLKSEWELGSYETVWTEIMRRLHARRIELTDLGLPPAFFGSPKTVGNMPLLLESFGLQSTHLLVDTENLRMGYEKESVVHPDRYRDIDVDSFTRKWLPRVVRDLAHRHKVPPHCVSLVGKSRTRVTEIFGELDDGWKIIDPGTGQRSGSNDDAALARRVGWLVGQDPRARIVVLTGDGNLTLVLNDEERPRNLCCYSPFEMLHALVNQAPADWTLQPHLFRQYGIRKPANVPEDVYHRVLAANRTRRNQ
jgi:hypothetical protein